MLLNICLLCSTASYYTYSRGDFSLPTYVYYCLSATITRRTNDALSYHLVYACSRTLWVVLSILYHVSVSVNVDEMHCYLLHKYVSCYSLCNLCKSFINNTYMLSVIMFYTQRVRDYINCMMQYMSQFVIHAYLHVHLYVSTCVFQVYMETFLKLCLILPPRPNVSCKDGLEMCNYFTLCLSSSLFFIHLFTTCGNHKQWRCSARESFIEMLIKCMNYPRVRLPCVTYPHPLFLFVVRCFIQLVIIH